MKLILATGLAGLVLALAGGAAWGQNSATSATSAKPAKAAKPAKPAKPAGVVPAKRPPLPFATAAPVSDDDIDKAIKAGVQYLLSLQSPDGTWPPYQNKTDANTIMSMLALSYAEYNLKTAEMKKGIRALIATDAENLTGEKTYQVAFRILALAKLMKKVDIETRELVLARLKRDARWVVEGQSKIGGWSYTPNPLGSEIGDFSNVQICVLALGEAWKAGVELPQEPFLRVQNLYLSQQLLDGGWSYGRDQDGLWPWTTDQAMPSYGSMTAAGVASLFITREYLYPGLGCPCRDGKSNYQMNKVDEAIDRGLKWLGEHYEVEVNPKATHFELYWHYSCERVGLASGIKYFGGHNWYGEGARWVLSGQGPRGGWGGERFDPPDKDNPQGNLISPPGTAWAMLFLIKGRAPVLMNKLQFTGAWNYHPLDLANLAKYVGENKEQPFAWQVINLDVPVDEWHDAPILYISAETLIKLTDEQKHKLRKFTDDGGTILFEASCGNTPVKAWWVNVSKEIWPEYEYRTLAKDHPVWTADVTINKRIPGLMEMSDGMRSFIIYSPVDLSCAWNQTQVSGRSEAFMFGMNLYTYATDRAKIRSRLAGVATRRSAVAEAKALSPGRRSAMQLVCLKHSGDWNVSARYQPLEKLAERINVNESFQLTVGEPAQAGDAKVPPDAVLFATGRVNISLGDAEQRALAARLAKGGFLVVDAAMGDARFDKSFKELAAQMRWTVKLLTPEEAIVSGVLGSGSSHRLDDLNFTYAAVNKGTALKVNLQGIYKDNKLVGVYSDRDLLYTQAGLRAFNCNGYDIPSAQLVVDNIVTYATTISSEPAAAPAASAEPATPAAAAN